MKLLHTSDWHLGAKLGRHDRTPDHLAAVRALIELAEESRPDLILHTGDLFDATRPPYPALRIGVRALQRLASVAPTVVICGNHDSSALFGVLDEMAGTASPRRLRFVTEPRVLEFHEIAGKPVAVACVPFIPPGAVADYATDDPARFEGTYADGIRTLNTRLLGEAERVAGPTGIVLYAAHLHVHGARPGTSERRFTVGEDHATHTDGLHRALYSAFGHIHDPQLLPGGTATGRYAGSLIPLDFGEGGQAKQAVLVTIEDDVQVDTVEMPPGRPLVTFAGTLGELEGRAAEGGLDNTILKACVTSEDPIPDLADRLAEWSPECAVFNIANEVANRRARAISQSAGDSTPDPDIADLFAEWRDTAARGVKAPHAAVLELFGKTLGSVGHDADPDFGVTALTVRAIETFDALAQARKRQGAQG